MFSNKLILAYKSNKLSDSQEFVIFEFIYYIPNTLNYLVIYYINNILTLPMILLISSLSREGFPCPPYLLHMPTALWICRKPEVFRTPDLSNPHPDFKIFIISTSNPATFVWQVIVDSF